MPRKPIFILVMLFAFSLACNALSPAALRARLDPPEAILSPTPSPATTRLSSLTPAPHTQTPAPTPIQKELLTPSAAFTLRLHPEDGLFTGDVVSFEVLAPTDADVQDHLLTISLYDQPVGEAKFGLFGIGRRQQATLVWAWDTSSLEAGEYDLVFDIPSLGHTWIETVRLQPREAMHAGQQEATWARARSDCCLLHYVSGTAGERDLDEILEILDEQAVLAVEQMQLGFTQEIEVVLLPRVLGHGGFASGEISITYLDRNYANNNLAQVVLHEMIHILDYRRQADYRPSMFVEGIAVYLSNGHFKREPLFSRAAALLDMGWYIPLHPLADNFYNSQHEIGYLQAGALIQFMVQQWGWEAFDRFYRSIPEPPSGLASESIDLALLTHFGLSLPELEARFKDALRRQISNPDLEEDVRLGVEYYDLVRRYQQALDPSAYFLTAWLLPGGEMRRRGIVGDYLRHPRQTENLTLEVMLVAAGDDLFQGRYPEARRLLVAIERVLAEIEAGDEWPFTAHPLATEYHALIIAAESFDGEVQRIELEDEKARLWLSTTGADLVEVELIKSGEAWR